MKTKLSTKLIGGFFAVAAICALVGGVGWYGITQLDGAMDEIGGVRLPSIQSLLELSEAQTAVVVGNRGLTNPRMSDPAVRAKQYEYVEAAWKRAKEARKAYDQLPKSMEETAERKTFEDLWNTWQPLAADVAVQAREVDRLRANGASQDAVNAQDMKAFSTVVAANALFFETHGSLSKLIAINSALAVKARTEGDRTVIQMKRAAAIAVLAGFLVAASLGFALSTSIARSLNRVIAALGSGADQVASTSEQTSSASQEVAQSAAGMAASLEETSSSIEELTSMIQQNADHAGQANQLMKDTRSTVENANGAMGEMNVSMNDIKGNSDDIAKIIKVIEEIAFQTNLLALNAAVEAARAGEHGKGFAVVAEEVRNLAQRAGASARDTGALIEKAVRNVNDGLVKVAGVAKGLKEITDSSVRVGNLVEEISNASREQAQGINQINAAVSEMDKTTQGVAANSEETAAAAEEMSAQAIALQENVRSLIALVEGTA